MKLVFFFTKHLSFHFLSRAGGDNNLAVIMGGYKSPSAIQCRGHTLITDSCNDVLEDMPATTEMEIFGPITNTSATVLLPQAVQSGKLRNQVPYCPGFLSDRPLSR